MKIETLVRKVLLEIEQDSKETTQKDVSKGPNLPSPEYSLSNDELNKLLSSKEQTESEISVNKKELPEQNLPGQNTGDGTNTNTTTGGDDDGDDDETFESEESYFVCADNGPTGCYAWVENGDKAFTIEELKQGVVAINSDTWVALYSDPDVKSVKAGSVAELVNENIVSKSSPKVLDRDSWVKSFPECVREYNRNEVQKYLYTEEKAFQDKYTNFYQIRFYSTKRTGGYLAVGIDEDGKTENLVYNCDEGTLSIKKFTGELLYQVGQKPQEEESGGVEQTVESESNAIFEINNSLGITFQCEKGQTNCTALFINARRELNKNALYSINQLFLTWIGRGNRGDAIGQYYELLERLQNLYTILNNNYPTYTPYEEALKVVNDLMTKLDTKIGEANKFISTVPSMKGNLDEWDVITSPNPEDQNYNVKDFTPTTPYIKNTITLYIPKGIGIGKAKERASKIRDINVAGYVDNETCKKSLLELGRAAGVDSVMKLKYAPDAEDKSWFEKLFVKGGITQGGEALQDSDIQELKQTIAKCANGRMYKGKYKDIYDDFFGSDVPDKYKINPRAEDAMGQSTSKRQKYTY